jgi:hypothetical protein
MIASPWAVLLCRFKDTNDTNIPLARVNGLFTTAGAGTLNVPRYFAEMSHGLLDLDESQVFPQSSSYFTINANVGDYVAPSDPPPPGWSPTITRDQLIKKAYDAAAGAGVPLSQFYGVVIVFNVAIGITFGGASSVGPFVCSDYRYVTNNGTATHGHEMGHAYGLQHSRRQGSTADYQDRWDIMSALNTWFAPDPDYGARGPGLNAANMRAVGWLDSTRVWRGPATGFDEIIELRPLHRRDLPGNLAAEFPPIFHGLLVEYRLRQEWDSAIPRSTVMVHSFVPPNSYLMSSTLGNPDLVKGQIYEQKGGPFLPALRLEVLDIDDAVPVARVRMTYSPAPPLPADWYGIFSHFVGQVFADGPGLVWNGRQFVPVPPWNPMARMLESVGEWMAAERLPDPQTRVEALRVVAARMQAELATAALALAPIHPPAPRALTHVIKWGRAGREGRSRSKRSRK